MAFDLPVEIAALHSLPAIVFFADHGFDVREPPLCHAVDRWEATAFETEETFLVYFECGSETLEVELTRSLEVLDSERRGWAQHVCQGSI